MSMPAAGVLWVSDSTASPYLKVASLTMKIQISSKLRQFQKWQAEIPDTPQGLTGIGILRRVLVHWLAQCHAKWQRGSREFQHPAGIEPTSPASGSLQLKLTTKPWVQIDLVKEKKQYMTISHI